MKKISLMLAIACMVWLIQPVQAQTIDSTKNRIEIKKKVKTGAHGRKVTKIKMEGTGTTGAISGAADGAVTGKLPAPAPVTIVNPPAPDPVTPMPAQTPSPAPEPATPTVVVVAPQPPTPPAPQPTTTVTTTTETKPVSVAASSSVSTNKTTYAHVARSTNANGGTHVYHRTYKKKPATAASTKTTTTTTVKKSE